MEEAEERKKKKKVGISLVAGRESKVGTRNRERRESWDTRRADLLTCYRHKWEVKCASNERDTGGEEEEEAAQEEGQETRLQHTCYTQTLVG